MADILSLLGINLAAETRADFRRASVRPIIAEDQLLIMLVGYGSISFIGELNHHSKRAR